MVMFFAVAITMCIHDENRRIHLSAANVPLPLHASLPRAATPSRSPFSSSFCPSKFRP